MDYNIFVYFAKLIFSIFFTQDFFQLQDLFLNSPPPWLLPQKQLLNGFQANKPRQNIILTVKIATRTFS